MTVTLPKKKKKKGEAIKKKPSEASYSILSRATFHWAGRLLSTGKKCQFGSVEDLSFSLPPAMDPIRTHEKLNRALDRYLNHNTNEFVREEDYGDDIEANVGDEREPFVRFDEGANVIKKPNKFFLVWALNKAFWWSFWPLHLIQLFSAVIELASPIILNLFLKELETEPFDVGSGALYLGILVTLTLTSTFINTHFNFLVAKLKIRTKGALIAQLYRKILAVNTTTLSRVSVGEITNYASQDAEQATDYLNCLFEVWYIPLKLAVTFYLLYRYVGTAFLAGMSFCVILIPLNQWISRVIGRLYDDLMEFRDLRIKRVHEILTHILPIKMSGWEAMFRGKLNRIRTSELRCIRISAYLDALGVFFWGVSPPLITFLIVLTYALLPGNTASVSVIFTTLALVQHLVNPLNHLPWVFMGILWTWTSVKRISSFLEQPETSPGNTPVPLPLETGNAMELRGASFYHDSREKCCLLGVDLGIQKKELVFVMGRTGSGKSSLLLALCQELNLARGQVHLNSWGSGAGVVLQEPWITTGSVLENILDGSEYDPEWYGRVVGACALDRDLRSWPRGDHTEVGTGGSALSGGQKARVTLARAVYKNKDVYLIDDIFSSLDGKVAAHIFEQCICGLLAGKTRVVCTHHRKFSGGADRILVLEEGQVSYFGEPSTTPPPPLASSGEGRDGEEEGTVMELPLPTYEEERCFGAVQDRVYRGYCRAGGWMLAVGVGAALLGMQLTDNLSSGWLSYWTSAAREMPPPSEGITTETKPPFPSITTDITFYLMVYCGLIAANTIFTLLRSFSFAVFSVTSASTLHTDMQDTVLSTVPLSFFTTTPVGVLLNRFSRDVYQVDMDLPYYLNNFLGEVVYLGGCLIVTCYGVPRVLLVIAPVALLYHLISQYYRTAVRELKRLFSSVQSPVFSHFEETLRGAGYIHAGRQSPTTLSRGLELLREFQRTDYCLAACGSWLELRLQALAALVLGVVAGVIVVELYWGTTTTGTTTDVALLALALTYALTLNESLVNVVQSFTDVEKQLIGAERLLQYTYDLPTAVEPVTCVLGRRGNTPWPTSGGIEFRGVTVRYPGAPTPSLNNFTLKVSPGQKVGMVGRTGAGKSTVLLALLRMVELEAGQIVIDSLDVSSIRGCNLRQRVSVLPQHPFVFDGTIRENVDPGEEYGEDQVRACLERCQLAPLMESRGGLDGVISSEVLSAGERQLLCLARILLRKAPILCLDEATSGVDMATDALIQEIIQEEFKSATVLTIAHRLETILDYDRVLVLREGQLIEDGQPRSLMEDLNSDFHQMAVSSGLAPRETASARKDFISCL